MDELELRHAEAHYAEMPRDGYSGRCEMLLPEDLRGMRVLDLGCRNGKGACKLADRVGPDGFLYHAGVFADEPLPTAVMQAFACAGNVFGAARSQAEFARIAVDRAGFSSCSFERERPVEPDGSDAAEELRGRSFTAAIARARR